MAVKPKFILASRSSRRRELIQMFDLQIITAIPDVDENMYNTYESPNDLVLRLSMEKARSVHYDGIDADVVLGADTIVVLDNRVIGKPSDASDAINTLTKLEGRSHIVITGMTALNLKSNKYLSTVTTTKVLMRNYTSEEIELYVDSKLPMDKSGGYGIQDSPFNPVKSVDGCYYNVVGLPICEVKNLLDLLELQTSLKRNYEFLDKCHDCHLRQSKIGNTP